jgi:polysaccharide export outer membrane protein
MMYRRRGRLGTAFILLAGLAATAGGCSTFPHAAAASGGGRAGPQTAQAADRAPTATGAFTRVAAGPGVLQPRSEFEWTVEVGTPPRTQSGPGVVGPDGTVLLGPYGAVKVAGLTLEQARVRIEQHVRSYERNARVTLRLPQATASAWRPTSPIQQVAQFQPEQVPAAPPPSDRLPQGVKSTWRPIQREPVAAPDLGAPPARETANQFGTAAGPRPIKTASWQGPGWPPLQHVGDSGPELAPSPKVVNPPPNVPFTPPNAAFMPPKIVSGGPVPPDAVLHGPLVPEHAPNEERPVTLPRYKISPPDILQIDSLEGLLTQPVRGPHLVRPDGTVGVGAYGSVYVAGMTVDQAKVEIGKLIHARLDPAKRSLKDVLDGLSVDILAYNSQVYYVITDRTGFGEIVQKFPITGNERVLDAISNIQGLPPEASKHKVWVARRVPGHANHENVMPVDWIAISQHGSMATNYQLLPGDRLYVKAEAIQRIDYVLAKVFSPIQRIFGIVLLGSETVNSIRNGGVGGGGTTGR